MGKGKGTRSKAGGANEAILRRDRELRDKNARAEKDDIDDHDTKNERFISFLSNSNKNSGKTGESDDDEDADDDAAFDLAAGGSSSEDEDEDKESGESNSDEGSENASGDESGDDDEDGDDEENDESYDGVPIDLKRLIDDLSPSLRQKVLSGQKIRVDGASSDDSDSDSESKSKVSKLSNSDAAAALTGNWGKKRNYWSGDTADLEIGQDMQDALDEEQAANEIQANRLRGMDVNDYGSSDGDSEYESDQQFSSKNNKTDISMHAVNRDISSLTKKQRLKLLTLDAPELLAVTSGALKKNIVVNLLQVLTPLRTFLATDMVQQFYARSKDEDGETVSELLGERERAFIEYIHLKELLLSNYLVNLLFLMSMHVQSIPTRSHPVMKQLLELQYALQKMSVLDTKFQVDSVLLLDIAGKSKSSKKSSKTQQSAIETYFESARTEIVSNNACYRHESEEESNASDSDSNSDIDRQDENDLKSNSEDEYEAYVLNDEANMNGISSKKHRYYKTQSSSEEDESENDGILDLNGYNDSINTNSKLAKEQHKAKKQALKMSLEAFGGAYEKDVSSRKKCGVDDMVATIEPTLAKPTKLRRLENDRDDNEEYEWESHLSNKNKKGRKEGDSYEDGYDPVAMEKLRGALTSMYGDDGMASRQRRPVPSAVDEEQCAVDENSDDDQAALEIYEAFDGKKKAFLKKKKEHYKPEARYGSMFEMEAADVAKGFKNNKSSQKPVSDGAIKRAATYEMMKNKGLTPHRKKENRNPRVKKRIAYDKALVARRGQVREVNSTGVNTVSSYGGETTGIKSNLSRARKIST